MRAATMLTRADELDDRLLQANAMRVCWMMEAEDAVESSDAGREVTCEYHLCLIDGLIALIERDLAR
jgi:hypothetical protein